MIDVFATLGALVVASSSLPSPAAGDFFSQTAPSADGRSHVTDGEEVLCGYEIALGCLALVVDLLMREWVVGLIAVKFRTRPWLHGRDTTERTALRVGTTLHTGSS